MSLPDGSAALSRCNIEYSLSYVKSKGLLLADTANESKGNGMILKMFKPFQPLFTHQVVDDGNGAEDDEDDDQCNQKDEESDAGIDVTIKCSYTCLKWDVFVDVKTNDNVVKQEIINQISKSFIVPVNHLNLSSASDLPKSDGFTLSSSEFDEMIKNDDGYSDIYLSNGNALWSKDIDESHSFHIRSYSVGSQNSEEVKIARLIISRGQAMATWYIENASPVDISDPRWSVYTVFLMKNGKPIVLAGYTTIFEFTNPIKKRKIMRLCQIIVTPPFQKLGLGKALLLQLYKNAISDTDVFEVNVEDPCPEFTLLRDCCDSQNCMEKGIFFSLELDQFESYISPVTGKLLDKYAEEARSILKINKLQSQICFDAAWLNKIRSSTSSISSSEKAFRLSIKRRFYDEVAHVAGDGSQTQDEIKEKLQILYEEYYSNVFKILEILNKGRSKNL